MAHTMYMRTIQMWSQEAKAGTWVVFAEFTNTMPLLSSSTIIDRLMKQSHGFGGFGKTHPFACFIVTG